MKSSHPTLRDFRPLHTALVASSLLLAAGADAAAFSARNEAMGGTGVASSHYDAAASNNPALLTRFKSGDRFALTVPSVTVEGSDEYEVIDELDDITDLIDTLEAQINFGLPPSSSTVQINRDLLLTKLAYVDEKPVSVDGAARLGIAVPSKSLAFAVESRARIDVYGYADYDPGDEAIIDNAINTADSGLLDDLGSEAFIFGVQISEFAVSLAHEFTLGDSALAIGISPKYQRVETILYQVGVRDFDFDDIDDDRYTEDDSNLNVDIGIALSLSDSLTLGLQLRDLVEQDYDTVQPLRKYALESQATAAVAWRGDVLTLALDVDLLEQQPFADFDGSQFARAGIEFDLANWVQLRAGYRHDLQNTRQNLLTAGVGLSPFDVFHMDFTATAGDDETYGAALDIRLTF